MGLVWKEMTQSFQIQVGLRIRILVPKEYWLTLASWLWLGKTDPPEAGVFWNRRRPPCSWLWCVVQSQNITVIVPVSGVV